MPRLGALKDSGNTEWWDELKRLHGQDKHKRVPVSLRSLDKRGLNEASLHISHAVTDALHANNWLETFVEIEYEDYDTPVDSNLGPVLGKFSVVIRGTVLDYETPDLDLPTL